jgi:hypothetical protein
LNGESSPEWWDALRPLEVAGLLAECRVLWWIGGGYAIDAFVGRADRRPHEDVDVGLLARDQDALRRCLAGWDFHCADPPGHLRPWRWGERLEDPIHDVWVRERDNGPWRLQLMLDAADGEDWIYRREPRVRRPLTEHVLQIDGIPYLVPETQLLYKAKTMREKDELDFDDARRLLDDRRREWLRRALGLAHPGHPWLARL